MPLIDVREARRPSMLFDILEIEFISGSASDDEGLVASCSFYSHMDPCFSRHHRCSPDRSLRSIRPRLTAELRSQPPSHPHSLAHQICSDEDSPRWAVKGADVRGCLLSPAQTLLFRQRGHIWLSRTSISLSCVER